jgi:hypothetical protein
MTVPANIAADLTGLQAAYNAAAPLTLAPATTIAGLALQAESAANDIDAAVLLNAGALDNFSPPAMAPAIATAVVALLTAAQTQSALTDVRGVVGRIATTLAQAV